ncbi:hypothetical protein LTR27_009695 [Elasticomyces elasticus]|nr:hypothetical protein LTR27_009695 [Elasticomyces elasticus]
MADRDHTLHLDDNIRTPSTSSGTAPSFPPPVYLNGNASANDETLPVYEQSPLFPAYNSGEKQYSQASEREVEAQQSPAEAVAHIEAQGARGANNVVRPDVDPIERRLNRCCCWTGILLLAGFFICIAVSMHYVHVHNVEFRRENETRAAEMADATAKLG